MKQKSAIPINQEEISVYLKDVRKLKVMTPERERVLADKMLSGKISLKEKEEIKKEIDYFNKWINLHTRLGNMDTVEWNRKQVEWLEYLLSSTKK